ncbi:hypothetical protein NC796_09040 [Aliifodinibius sp. S!AR15-10]|uniref:DUF6794 domain-containing protein n=1 Tax=Aliifodinibius sp. S!AR15-10 TaxID=2950437 RepID=UPI002864E183|nr:DUF6794 domain-containing protein [Aliifodinibius sp. S!AR15-10]MDR8391280.1 hypothetical protein [Aliifodinibius sp. S!AR15-10]
MRTYYFSILLFLVTCSVSFGQPHKIGDYTITPTIDSTFSHNVYIPENLEGSFRELDKMLTEALIDEIKSCPSEELLLRRFNTGPLGEWIQRNWGFRDLNGSRLSRHLHGMGIQHPTHMSAVILESYWRYLHGQQIRVEDQMPLLQES